MQQLNNLDLVGTPTLEITTSVGFDTWLDRQNLSIAFTTDRAGKIFFVGLQPRGRLSMIGQTNSANDWRDCRDWGGCVIDVKTNQIIATSLSMPHSPRWYKGKLWLLNSGTGELGYLDRQGIFKPVVFCPGYLRGCAFNNNYAVLGLSLPRDRAFSNLVLDKKLRQANTEAICGLVIIDLKKGEIVQWLRINRVVKELYDVSLTFKC